MYIDIDQSVPLSPESTSTITYPLKLNEEASIIIKMLLLSPFTLAPLSNLNDSLIPLLLKSELDISTYPEAIELLIPNEILIPILARRNFNLTY